MKKFLSKILAGLLLVTLTMPSPVFAYYSDIDISTDNITGAGHLDIEASTSGFDTLITPSSTASNLLTINIDSSISYEYKIGIDNISGDACEAVNLTIGSETYPLSSSFYYLTASSTSPSQFATLIAELNNLDESYSETDCSFDIIVKAWQEGGSEKGFHDTETVSTVLSTGFWTYYNGDICFSDNPADCGGDPIGFIYYGCIDGAWSIYGQYENADACLNEYMGGECSLESVGECEPSFGTCGNNVQEAGEECDDGNLENGDGCSIICTIENNNPPTTTIEYFGCTDDACVSLGSYTDIDACLVAHPDALCSTDSECNNECAIEEPPTLIEYFGCGENGCTSLGEYLDIDACLVDNESCSIDSNCDDACDECENECTTDDDCADGETCADNGKCKNNNGHGNNEDDVDTSNPGNSKDGDDTDPADDDETKKGKGHTQDIVTGCMDETATNYNPDATEDNGSCEYNGCTDPNADNYDPNATIDDGTCMLPPEPEPEAPPADPPVPEEPENNDSNE